MDYKLAVATPDGNVIAGDLEKSDYVVVFAIAQGRIDGWEIRDRRDHYRNGVKGHLPLQCLEECRYLIANEVGDTVEQMCRDNGIEYLKTDLPTVTEALAAYFEGELAANDKFLEPHPRA